MLASQEAQDASAKGPFYATVEAAESFAGRLLLAHGLPEHDASIVACHLVRADLRGVDAHRLQYLPHYLERIRREFLPGDETGFVHRQGPIPAAHGQTGAARTCLRAGRRLLRGD